MCEPTLDGNEEKYLLDAFRSGWISSKGEYLQRFEQAFSRYVGVRYGVATTSGTSALHLALVAAGVRPGDEVILPSFAMVACAFAVCYCGARPVFVDADPDIWTMDWRQIESRISPLTKAILVVHIYGHPVDMDPVRQIATRRNLQVVEDAAEAHGSRYKGRLCGSLSSSAAFSFYANKIITTGEGGMVVTDDEVLYRACQRYKNLCFPLDGARAFWHEDVGFNYRMTNLQAAIGLAQLERIETLIQARRKTAMRYLEQLREVPLVQLPVEKPWAENTYWMFGVVLKPECRVSRGKLAVTLREAGIDTRPFFMPLHRQPALRKHGVSDVNPLPVSDYLGNHGFYLPSSGALTDAQVNYICDTLKRLLV